MSKLIKGDFQEITYVCLVILIVLKRIFTTRVAIPHISC